MGIFVYGLQDGSTDSLDPIDEYVIDPVVPTTTSSLSYQLRKLLNVPIFIEFDTTNTNQNQCQINGILSNWVNLNSPVTFNTLALYPYSNYYMVNSVSFRPIYPFNGDTNFNSEIKFTGAVYLTNGFFSDCKSFNGIISAYNENLPVHQSNYNPQYNLGSLFYNCHSFNQPVTTNLVYNIITNAILDFNYTVFACYLFCNCYNFNQPMTLYNNGYLPISDISILENCYSFNSIVKIDKSYRSDITSIQLNRLLYNCYNMSQNIEIKFNASQVTSISFAYMLYGRNTASRINVFASNTDLLYNARNSLVGPALSWTPLPGEDCIYNEAYNIYLYNNL